MITGLGQGCKLAPYARGRVVDLVSRDRHSVDAASTNRVNLPVEGGHANRAARALEWRQGSPAIACRIVFEGDIQGAQVDVPGEATDDGPCHSFQRRRRD